jgi:hypothetical protein
LVKKVKQEVGVVKVEEEELAVRETKTRSLKRVKDENVGDEVLSSLAERVKRRRR